MESLNYVPVIQIKPLILREGWNGEYYIETTLVLLYTDVNGSLFLRGMNPKTDSIFFKY
jgi:hypothetical protein